MSVSNYLAKSEYGCRYHYDKLKDVIYLVSEDHAKDIIIDNGEAYISGLSETPLRIEGFGIDFREETSLDERYRFQKTLNLNIEGVPEISAGFRWTNIDPNEDYWCENFNKYYKQVLEENIVDIYQKYYLIVESKDGTFFMVNVDFPSDASYTYNLSKNSNQTTFSFSSVSNFPTLKLNGFNPERTSDCKVYKNNYIKDTVYLVSEDNIGNVFIDGGQSYVSGLTETPLKLNGFNAEFKEEVSFDERYRFQKTLTISIDGYATFEVLNQKYYPIVETKDGTFLMINVDFPSKVTHTYNLSRGINQTDFTFSTLSNFPIMKLIGFNQNDTVSCKPYNVNGAEGLRMLEAARTDFSETGDEIISTEPFKTVEYLGESLSLQEVYDGSKFTTTLEFNIAFDAYKSSWQYNLLEFVMNKYAAIIGIKGSSNKIYTGFKEGLEPNYTIQANATQGQSDIITLRLVEMSNRGLVIGDLGERIITDKHWRYVSKVGNIHSYECDGFGYAIYLLQEECDCFGNPTGRYKVLEGYADRFPTLNIVGTFNEQVYFYNPYCTDRIFSWELTDLYECENPGPTPTPIQIGTKWIATYSNGTVVTKKCDYDQFATGECFVAHLYRNEIEGVLLTDVYVGECVYEIKNNVFADNKTLSALTIDGSHIIEEGACSGCTNLKSVIVEGPVTFGFRSFKGCTSLTDLSVTTSYSGSGYSADFLGESFESCTSLSSVTINGNYFLHDNAFWGCSNVSKFNSDENGVLNLRNANSGGTLYSESFPVSSKIRKVLLGECAEIEDFAFYYFSNLTSITCYATTPPTIYRYTFGGYNGYPIYVPAESVSTYKNEWGNFVNVSRIQAIE